MCAELVIEAKGLGKAYRIWNDHAARMKFPLLKLAAGWLPSSLQPKLLTDGGAAGYYREFHALKNLDLEVRRGEAIGIIGRNGSGKSTLLQMIAGTLTPSSGCVRREGRIAALLELGSGFNPDFTGRENVYLNGAILGLSKSEIDAVFDDICAFAEIGDFMDQPIRTYSSGMGLRLAFAVLAHVKADILIIDEALAVGDVFFVQKCMRWIHKFRETGTLLFVTHSTADITALCDRALWLKDGQAQLFGDAKSVAEAYLAFYHAEETGGKVVEANTSTSSDDRGLQKVVVRETADQREAWLGQTETRNDLRPIILDPERSIEGIGAAVIESTLILDQDTRTIISHINGGEHVILQVSARAQDPLLNPVIGFYFKDRLGQYLFGDNTYLSNQAYSVVVPTGAIIQAEFSFQIPLLNGGQYVISSVIATKSQDGEEQQIWMHEALILESTNALGHRGLVAIPMLKIETSISSPNIISLT